MRAGVDGVRGDGPAVAGDGLVAERVPVLLAAGLVGDAGHVHIEAGQLDLEDGAAGYGGGLLEAGLEDRESALDAAGLGPGLAIAGEMIEAEEVANGRNEDGESEDGPDEQFSSGHVALVRVPTLILAQHRHRQHRQRREVDRIGRDLEVEIREAMKEDGRDPEDRPQADAFGE